MYSHSTLALVITNLKANMTAQVLEKSSFFIH